MSAAPANGPKPTAGGRDAGYLFTVLAAPVAQTCSLLYRRFLTCQLPPASNVLPITNRRYGRLKICATINAYDADRTFPNLEFESLSKILRRVAYPVEPFRFKFVQNDLSPSILAGICERSGKQPSLLDQVDDCQANDLQCSHRMLSTCCITGVTSEF